MDFIHSRKHLQQGDVVVVDCSHQSNILLMDDSNFSKYKNGNEYRHFGGFYDMLPARISVPHTGNWNITIDLGGRRANIEYSINILS